MLLEGNSFFQMPSYARANLRITNEKTKGKFPWGHHVVWNGKTKCTSWKGLFISFYEEYYDIDVATYPWRHGDNVRVPKQKTSETCSFATDIILFGLY